MKRVIGTHENIKLVALLKSHKFLNKWKTIFNNIRDM